MVRLDPLDCKGQPAWSQVQPDRWAVQLAQQVPRDQQVQPDSRVIRVLLVTLAQLAQLLTQALQVLLDPMADLQELQAQLVAED